MPSAGEGRTVRIWSAPTPNWRWARKRYWAALRPSGPAVSSRTTKSLPAPCILVKRICIRRLSPARQPHGAIRGHAPQQYLRLLRNSGGRANPHNAPMTRPSQLLHPQRQPVDTLKASTVLLLRDRADGQGLEVLMTRRSPKASFVPSAYVFPGGGIEAQSEERRVGKECRSRWSPYH